MSRAARLAAGLILLLAAPAAGQDLKRWGIHRVLDAEARDARLCESIPGRVHVTYALGGECIAYTVHDGRRQIYGEKEKGLPIVFLIDGDRPLKLVRDKSEAVRISDLLKRGAEASAFAYRVMIVRLQRYGIEGSSGDESIRKSLREVHALNAAIDAIKTKLDVKAIALAGQSGGATIAAGILALGRTDVTCAALASGQYYFRDLVEEAEKKGTYRRLRQGKWSDPYNVGDEIGSIVKDSNRRIFVIGDPQDKVVSFSDQKRFHSELVAKGLRADLVLVKARDETRHSLMVAATRVASRCATGRYSDDGLFDGLERLDKNKP